MVRREKTRQQVMEALFMWELREAREVPTEPADENESKSGCIATLSTSLFVM